VAIYTVGVLTLATIGGAVTATVGEAGALIFAISPFLMPALLRSLGGDGWQDAGHGIGNTVLWAGVQSDLIAVNNKIVAQPAPEGILMIVLWGALAWWALSRNSPKLNVKTAEV
jgi:hypothetical protein